MGIGRPLSELIWTRITFPTHQKVKNLTYESSIGTQVSFSVANHVRNVPSIGFLVLSLFE